jgi:hypothetical protein
VRDFEKKPDGPSSKTSLKQNEAKNRDGKRGDGRRCSCQAGYPSQIIRVHPIRSIGSRFIHFHSLSVDQLRPPQGWRSGQSTEFQQSGIVSNLPCLNRSPCGGSYRKPRLCRYLLITYAEDCFGETHESPSIESVPCVADHLGAECRRCHLGLCFGEVCGL